MHQQLSRQLQETLTSLPVGDVLDSATTHFARESGVYGAFLEKQGENYVSLRGMGGEEVVIAARITEGGVAVTASSYLFDAQIARFLGSLPPADPTPPEAESAAGLATPALTSGVE